MNIFYQSIKKMFTKKNKFLSIYKKMALYIYQFL